MSDFLHTPNCDIVHQEKVKILNENGVFHNDDNFTLLYVDIGPKSETMILADTYTNFITAAQISKIKQSIIKSFFCPCCVSDIELKAEFFPLPNLYDGQTITVSQVKGKDGKWSQQLFVQH